MAYNNFGEVFFNKALSLVAQDVEGSSLHHRKSSDSTWADLSNADSFQEGDQANHLRWFCRHSSESSDLGSCTTPGLSSPSRLVTSGEGGWWFSPPLSPEWTVTLSREDLAPQVSWLLLAWRTGGRQCMPGQPQEISSAWAHWSGGWTELGPGQSDWQHPWPPVNSGHTRELPQSRLTGSGGNAWFGQHSMGKVGDVHRRR